MNLSTFWSKLYQIIVLLGNRIKRDRIKEVASSLTYQTVLALVPLFAVLFGIAKGFSLDKILEETLQERFADHKEILQHLLSFSQTTLEQMKSGLIAGVGILFLLITTTNLLFTTENIMNRMWGVTKGRSLARRISDFQSCLFLFPILLVISSSTTIFIQTLLYGIQESWSISFVIQPFILTLSRLLPLVTVWIVFALCYWLIPYVPVKKRYALSTALIITCIFHALQSSYIYMQLKLTKISVIYGSFAAIPLFLVWVWISWLLFLLGAELMVFLHEKGWKKEILSWDDSEEAYLSLTITLMNNIVANYKKGFITSVIEYREKLDVPMYALSKTIEKLQSRNLIYVFSSDKKQVSLVPSQKGLESKISDLLFPSFDSLSNEAKASITTWQEQQTKEQK